MKSASEIDKLVGENLRKVRRIRRVSLKDLASAVGLSYQQLQKYERGTNRISAGRLCQFADELDVSIVSFFEGLDMTVPGDSLDLSLDHLRLLQDYDSLSIMQKKSVQGYVQFLANHDGEEATSLQKNPKTGKR